MTGVYTKHLENKKRVESEANSARENRRGKKQERINWHRSTALTVGSSDKYREGWDRIFGKKKEEQDEVLPTT